MFPGGVILQGRVMAARSLRRPRVDDSAWVNLARMLRHWLTEEEPFAEVEARCAGVAKTTEADEEGYFEILFDHPKAIDAKDLEMRLPGANSEIWRTTPILRHPPDFKFLIISDVDDTILETNAASILKSVKTTLFGNVLTREVFPGTADLMENLTAGGNPVFYVTSSPWNLRGFLRSVFERYDLPKGGFFMTDWGLDKEKWFTKSHRHHKLEAIQRILFWHPDRKIILLGDSSQKDPDIYAEVAELYPDRVRMILIRNVSHRKRRIRKVEETAQNCRDKGISFFVCQDSDEMQEHVSKVI